uniref:Uncharacterized protein n=1 Tax=Steinernema glaseri TaxID=37863 RepID=A0A1I8ARD9_9BILA
MRSSEANYSHSVSAPILPMDAGGEDTLLVRPALQLQFPVTRVHPCAQSVSSSWKSPTSGGRKSAGTKGQEGDPADSRLASTGPRGFPTVWAAVTYGNPSLRPSWMQQDARRTGINFPVEAELLDRQGVRTVQQVTPRRRCATSSAELDRSVSLGLLVKSKVLLASPKAHTELYGLENNSRVVEFPGSNGAERFDKVIYVPFLDIEARVSSADFVEMKGLGVPYSEELILVKNGVVPAKEK